MTGTSSKPLAHGSHRREADTKSFANKNIGAQKEPGKFGRMFPTLEDKPFEAKDADLTKLAEAMVDPKTPVRRQTIQMYRPASLSLASSLITTLLLTQRRCPK